MTKKDVKEIDNLVKLEQECGHTTCDFDDLDHDLREIAECIGVDYYIDTDEILKFNSVKDKKRVKKALNYYYGLHN